MLFNYFTIPLIILCVAVFGSVLTSIGMKWYEEKIKKPQWMPKGRLIGVIWTILYVLIAIAVLSVWNTFTRSETFQIIIGLFIINAILNGFWSYLFFYKHKMGAAIIECVILGISVVALIIIIWPLCLGVALLLIPYAVWVFFATYLNYSIWRLN